MTNEDLKRFYQKNKAADGKDFVRADDLVKMFGDVQYVNTSENGVEITYETGMTFLLPIVGSDSIVIDTAEDGKHIEIHLA